MKVKADIDTDVLFCNGYFTNYLLESFASIDYLLNIYEERPKNNYEDLNVVR